MSRLSRSYYKLTEIFVIWFKLIKVIIMILVTAHIAEDYIG